MTTLYRCHPDYLSSVIHSLGYPSLRTTPEWTTRVYMTPSSSSCGIPFQSRTQVAINVLQQKIGIFCWWAYKDDHVKLSAHLKASRRGWNYEPLRAGPDVSMISISALRRRKRLFVSSFLHCLQIRGCLSKGLGIHILPLTRQIRPYQHSVRL